MAKSDIYAMNCGDFHSLVFYIGLQNTLFSLLTITCNDRTLDFMQLLEEDEDCLEEKRTEEKRREKYHKCQKQWVSQQMMKGRRDKETYAGQPVCWWSLSHSSFSCKESPLPCPSCFPCGAAFSPDSRICEANKTRNNRQSGNKMMTELTLWSSSHTYTNFHRERHFLLWLFRNKAFFSKLKFTHYMSYEQCFSFLLKESIWIFINTFFVVFFCPAPKQKTRKLGEWEQK